MRAVVFCGSIFSLHLFLCVHCLPVHDRRTGSRRKLQVSQSQSLQQGFRGVHGNAGENSVLHAECECVSDLFQDKGHRTQKKSTGEYI